MCILKHDEAKSLVDFVLCAQSLHDYVHRCLLDRKCKFHPHGVVKWRIFNDVLFTLNTYIQSPLVLTRLRGPEEIRVVRRVAS